MVSADGKTFVLQDAGRMVVLDVDTGRKTELSGGAVDLSANGRFVVYLTGLSSGANALHIYDHRTKTSSPVTVPVNGENVAVIVVGRSEERRVGKECRTRRARYDEDNT